MYYTRLIKKKFDMFKVSSVFIRINYGYGPNVKGKRTLFHNAGTYYKFSDLEWAIKAFDEIKDWND